MLTFCDFNQSYLDLRFDKNIIFSGTHTVPNFETSANIINDL